MDRLPRLSASWQVENETTRLMAKQGEYYSMASLQRLPSKWGDRCRGDRKMQRGEDVKGQSDHDSCENLLEVVWMCV